MTKFDIAFEESLSDKWDDEDRGVAEVPLDDRPLVYVGVTVFALAAIVFGQVFYLNRIRSDFYQTRAEANVGYAESVPAPRGLIVDRYDTVIAENRAVFSALLDVRQFLKDTSLQSPTLAVIQNALGMSPETVWNLIHESDLERSAEPILLAKDISQHAVVAIREANIATIKVADAFERNYPEGPAFSTVIGYVGLATKKDLEEQQDLSRRDLVGKAGIESYYDDALRGTAGVHVTLRDAKGTYLGEQDEKIPKGGETLRLTIDAEFQSYFYERFMQALKDLDRTAGAGLAINPQDGEILAMISFPSYDNNVFVNAGKGDERVALLTNPERPLFNRTVNGVYSPGSTIKPLVGVAALTEKIISPGRTIFSPGYLDVPNPYDPSNPSRFLDWRYQGDVDLRSALAQSSNVYFYTVGGGANGIKGLGLDRLRSWWEKFGFGKKTGIDLFGEAEGFLPSAEWKQRATGRPWFLGDTYNVSIGQGDLTVTQVQLLSYIGAIANGGKVYQPHLNSTAPTIVNYDLSSYISAIQEAQAGMRLAVTGELGTAHIMNTLPFDVSGKTGSAQIKNNTQENAFFVGYAPTENPQIAILVLVENSRAGSLNAVPIAKDALNWYYEHRLKSK